MELVRHRLGQRDFRQGAPQGGEEARHAAMGGGCRRPRIRIHIDDAAIHLAIGGAAADRRDRVQERPAVQHAAVDEGHRRHVDIHAAIGFEVPCDEVCAAWPIGRPRMDELIDLQDAGGRESAGNSRGRARREGERGRVVEIEIAFHRAAGAAAILEMKHMTVLMLVDHRRIVDLHELLAAIEVRHRDEEVEPLAGRQQGRRPVARRPHHGDPVIHHGGHLGSVEGRLEPARPHEQRQLRAQFPVRDVLQAFHPREPEKRPQEPFAPLARLRVRGQQLGDVGIPEPEVAQPAHRQVVSQRPCQHGAVDPARRGSRHDVDDDAEFDRAADVAQEVEIDGFGVVFGIGGVAQVEEGRGPPLVPVRDPMNGAGGPGELQDLLGDPMHVDCERDAAETDQRYAELLFAQRRPRSEAIRRPAAIIAHCPQWRMPVPEGPADAGFRPGQKPPSVPIPKFASIRRGL